MDASAPIVLFDGECAFCNGWVNWIRKRDTADRFRFAPLGSAEGQALCQRHKLPPASDTVVVIHEGKAHVRSDAAWRILAQLPGHKASAMMLRLVPRPLRNWGYDLVARNRHRLGMKDTCELPGK